MSHDERKKKLNHLIKVNYSANKILSEKKSKLQILINENLQKIEILNKKNESNRNRSNS